MWLFTKYGFFSAVCARKRKGRPTLDPNKIMVRARDIEHLRALKERFVEIRGRKILSAAGTDYPYRIIVDKDIWNTIVYQLSEEIDYSNFKSAVFNKQGQTDYEFALHKVWQVMKDTEQGAVFYHDSQNDPNPFHTDGI